VRYRPHDAARSGRRHRRQQQSQAISPDKPSHPSTPEQIRLFRPEHPRPTQGGVPDRRRAIPSPNSHA
jgi:hypothetical protein